MVGVVVNVGVVGAGGIVVGVGGDIVVGMYGVGIVVGVVVDVGVGVVAVFYINVVSENESSICQETTSKHLMYGIEQSYKVSLVYRVGNRT